MNFSKIRTLFLIFFAFLSIFLFNCKKKTADNSVNTADNTVQNTDSAGSVKKQVGPGGMKVFTACADETNIYYLDEAGIFNSVDMETGVPKEIGNTGRTDAEFIFAAGGAVYMVTTDKGTLFAIDKTNAKLTQKGAEDECMNILEWTVYNNKLYHINLNNGGLHITDPIKGSTADIDNTDFLNTCVLTAGKDVLYAMQRDGNLYQINPSSGKFSIAGKNAPWDSTTSCVYINGSLYTTEAMGMMLKVNPATAEYEGFADEGFKGVMGMFVYKDKLVEIDEDGFIYHIEVK